PPLNFILFFYTSPCFFLSSEPSPSLPFPSVRADFSPFLSFHRVSGSPSNHVSCALCLFPPIPFSSSSPPSPKCLASLANCPPPRLTHSSVPGIGASLQKPFQEYLEAQRIKLHSKANEAPQLRQASPATYELREESEM
ncbi:Vacuole membrane protein 1, partial [Ophiophagus hannah]